MTPMISAKAKSLRTCPPHMNKEVTAINVVNDVMTVLPKVMFKDSLMTLSRDLAGNLSFTSLKRSKTTMVSFRE